MKSIRIKLVFLYIALVFIVMITSGTFIIVNFRLDETRKEKLELSSYADKLHALIIATQDLPTNIYNNYESLTPLNIQPAYSWAIINADTGTTAVSSMSKDPANQPVLKRSVIISALNGTERFESGKKIHDESGMKTYDEYARPTVKNGKTEYVIYVRKDASDFIERISQTTNTIALSVLVALFLAALIGLYFANTLTVPIVVLTRKAKEFASGKLDVQIEVASKDEIGQLTESFNNMARDINNVISEKDSEKNKLEIILNNMTDGVLSYDRTGKNIRANSVCTELLQMNDVEQLTLEELFERLGLSLPEKLFSKKTKDETISIGNKFINANINTYANKDGELEGVIVVLQDVTKHMKLDNMRREFVANVSHEIRTPLTTIKSYTETLLDGAVEEKDVATEFLTVINGEVDRMTLLVKDLLNLSQLDNKKFDLKIEKIDLVELLKDNIKQYKLVTEKNKQKIVFEPPSSKAVVEIDRERINQVISNIISNSLKYCVNKAVVNIMIQETEDYYFVKIKDNGMGVPKESLNRIFERFYRVDKARSRELGGTGLGLSIAKEIMEAHGGKISAVSDVGKGTTMILRFNKSNSL